MSEKKYTPCGGCGATDPIQRCIGCMHPFEQRTYSQEEVDLITGSVYAQAYDAGLKDNGHLPQPGPVWVRASTRLPGWRTPVKWRLKGVEMKKYDVAYISQAESPAHWMDLEWLDESATASESPAEQPVREVDKGVIEFIRDVAENWDCDPDSHTYNLRCRKCEATKLYNLFKEQKEKG